MEFFGLEETLYLDACGRWGVGGMNNVLLIAHAVVATNGARLCLAAVGVACNETHHFDGVCPFEAHGNDRRAHHGSLEGGEEWLAHQVGVVFIEYLVVELQHLHADYAQSLLLETTDDFAYQPSHYCARFEQHQGFFHFVVRFAGTLFSLRFLSKKKAFSTFPAAKVRQFLMTTKYF